MKGTIYALAEPNGYEIRYCGKTIKLLRDRLHCHAADAYRYRHRHLCNWLRAIYDRNEQPNCIVLQDLDLTGLDRSEQLRRLNAAEQSWIATLRSLGVRLTNATDGGDGCHGRVVSKETREKTARSNRGKKRSPETCEKFRQAALRRHRKTWLRGRKHPQFGKPQPWSPEHKEKWLKYWNGPLGLKARAENATRMMGNKRAARLTPEQVLEIRRAEGPQSAVAERFGVSQAYVSMVKRGLLWKELNEERS